MINCDCGYCDDYSTCLSDTYPIARKEHICCECNETIKPGEKYNVYTGVYDGDFFTKKTCLICDRIRNDFCRSGFIFGELRETLLSCIGIDYLKKAMNDE